MKRCTWLLAALLTYCGAAAAEPAAAHPDRTLTPVGAERVGNADGSVPPWDGGMSAPPPDWRPDQGYVDPFAAESPLFVISSANVAQHAARLSPGQLAMFRLHPGFRMPVYPSHRTAVLPAEVIQRVREQTGKVSLNGFGLAFDGGRQDARRSLFRHPGTAWKRSGTI